MSNLTGTDKSVILLMTIGEDRAAEVFKHLSQREVQTLSAAMANVTQISNKQLTDVLAEFEQEAEQFAALNINANDYLRSVLVKALGEERAASLLEDILETRDTASGIETLNFMEPQSAADLIRDEHPQIIATILVHLKRAQAADILALFDERLRHDVMLRIATFGGVQPAALAELTALQLLPRLNDGLVITQGFIGSENKGRTTTLGRGGSDYTAALLAEALHASRVDIWTDVPGIYTTDPRVVSAAKRIDEIAFAEAAEMATFGAKVLHPATLLPAVRSDIPVFVGSSKDPRAGGTLVCNKTENPPLFRALALRRNQTLLTLHSLNMLHSRGFLAEVFGILARHNISVDLITTSEVSVALTLDTTGSTSTGDTLLTQSLLMELSALCRVEVEEGLALVALIGNDLSKACGVGKEVFGVLEPFNIRMICYGASSHNLCFLVPGEDAEQVVQKLHSNLFE